MKIAFHTLGCKVNQYESEAMARMFRERGHEIVGEREFADVYVINTCTVTAVADRKSRQYIRRMKKVNPDSIVAVTGCYVQIDPEAVSKIEGVDILAGTNEKSSLPGYVEEFAAGRRSAGAKRDFGSDSDAKAGYAPDVKAGYAPDAKAADASNSKAGHAPDAKAGYAPDAKAADALNSKVGHAPDAEAADAPNSKADNAPDVKAATASDAKDANDSDAEAHVRDWKDLDSYENIGLVTSAENRTRAYIKIQEGCNRFCSYCVIPYARGNIRSRDLEEIVAEAKQLIDAGFKELVLTGINTALYGMEKSGDGGGTSGSNEQGFARSSSESPAAASEEATVICESPAAASEEATVICEAPAAVSEEAAVIHESPAAASEDTAMMREAQAAPYGVERVIAALEQLPGDFRIRLSSLEPAVVNAAYVKRLLKYERLCHHLHLSAQSGSDRILQAMNRPYRREGYLQIVETVRAFDPCYGISTDLIVGFPGEKEADFEDSLHLTEECDFCRTHVFRYSRRPKTRAAEMKEQVSPQVKNRRSDALQAAGERAQTSFCRKNAGQERTVLIEEYLPGEGMATGFTDNYIRIYIRCGEKEGQEMLNTFKRVRISEIWRDGCLGLIL